MTPIHYLIDKIRSPKHYPRSGLDEHGTPCNQKDTRPLCGLHARLPTPPPSMRLVWIDLYLSEIQNEFLSRLCE